MWEKLKSRKLLVVILCMIIGVLQLYKVNESMVSMICGTIMIVVPTIIYLIIEGIVDFKRVKESAEKIATLLTTFNEKEIKS